MSDLEQLKATIRLLEDQQGSRRAISERRMFNRLRGGDLGDCNKLRKKSKEQDDQTWIVKYPINYLDDNKLFQGRKKLRKWEVSTDSSVNIVKDGGKRLKIYPLASFDASEGEYEYISRPCKHAQSFVVWFMKTDPCGQFQLNKEEGQYVYDGQIPQLTVGKTVKLEDKELTVKTIEYRIMPPAIKDTITYHAQVRELKERKGKTFVTFKTDHALDDQLQVHINHDQLTVPTLDSAYVSYLKNDSQPFPLRVKVDDPFAIHSVVVSIARDDAADSTLPGIPTITSRPDHCWWHLWMSNYWVWSSPDQSLTSSKWKWVEEKQKELIRHKYSSYNMMIDDLHHVTPGLWMIRSYPEDDQMIQRILGNNGWPTTTTQNARFSEDGRYNKLLQE